MAHHGSQKPPGNGFLEEIQVDEEEQKVSEKIDDYLRSSRAKIISEGCSVLILGAEAGRRFVFKQFTGLPTAEIYEDNGDGVSIVEAPLDGIGSLQVKTFSCSKKVRSSRVLLSVADPSVLLYLLPLTSPFPNANSADLDLDTLSKSVVKALAHVVFICQELGTLGQTDICLVLSGCEAFREVLKRRSAGDTGFARLQKYFRLVNEDDDPVQTLMCIIAEFEYAIESYKPRNVRTLLIESMLDHRNGNETEADIDIDVNVAEQVLGVLRLIQKERIEELEKSKVGFIPSMTRSISMDRFSQNLITTAVAGALVLVVAYFLREKDVK
eukprot:CAMPEP_0204823948 /NCGR_PEP_ID=MMETSP1346-20131115/2025_1 /ASSEMBLY_ACC=CAM_ASM_000771 /TAXON_ID=215587 /ORGANISM="Aplanochytrium stocchinoi, Strain GSBS06" /LENGTH=325 /DNA_ID=CAMNT_0051950849 /DNA_START=179 /DNA_END=1156 /DNA_ORIENTATION=+